MFYEIHFVTVCLFPFPSSSSSSSLFLSRCIQIGLLAFLRRHIIVKYHSYCLNSKLLLKKKKKKEAKSEKRGFENKRIFNVVAVAAVFPFLNLIFCLLSILFCLLCPFCSLLFLFVCILHSQLWSSTSSVTQVFEGEIKTDRGSHFYQEMKLEDDVSVR